MCLLVKNTNTLTLHYVRLLHTNCFTYESKIEFENGKENCIYTHERRKRSPCPRPPFVCWKCKVCHHGKRCCQKSKEMYTKFANDSK